MDIAGERAPARSPWGWRLWFLACLLFVAAGWQQPANRGLDFSIAVVFGIIAARQRAAYVESVSRSDSSR